MEAFLNTSSDFGAKSKHADKICVRISQPAGLRELVEGKIDIAIDRGPVRYPGYRCDRLAGSKAATARDSSGRTSDYIITPEGTAECPEIVALPNWLLAGPDSILARRTKALR
jgi:LysR family glycine cleavage system transcriptional activator